MSYSHYSGYLGLEDTTNHVIALGIELQKSPYQNALVQAQHVHDVPEGNRTHNGQHADFIVKDMV